MTLLRFLLNLIMASKGIKSIPGSPTMLFNIAPTQTHKQTNFKLANLDAGPMTKAPFNLTKHD